MDVLLASVLSSVMTIMVVLFLTTTTPQKTTMVTNQLPSLAQQQKDKATCEAWDLLVENEIDEVLVPERKPSPILEEYRRLSSPFQTDTFDNLQWDRVHLCGMRNLAKWSTYRRLLNLAASPKYDNQKFESRLWSIIEITLFSVPWGE